MDAPEADVEVDAELVARLVAAQHPAFLGPVRPAASGWDNVIMRIGERWAARMPRRGLADRLVRSEQRWLREVAGSLPDGVAAPVPVAAGAPGAGYPYAWSITPWFDGGAAASVDPAERRAIAEPLADVLVALGRPAPAEAPANPFRGVPLSYRDDVLSERLSSGRLERVVPTDAAALAAVWRDALAAPPWAGAARWVHGDPHPGNLLVDGDAADGLRLVALLDFGDLTAGDPATDLAAAWLVFDPPGRARFRARVEALRPTDAGDWARARGWALAMGSAIVDTVGVGGPIGRVGAHALAQVLLD
ncbi:aminoglycoside phosphotransferase family protein [Agromyces tropicus]|uniref:Aminoglycoside phosphotransferase family protein n=1 Tax=Agromyces tropicus TaxID=555371 RepID=A0ABN2U9L0_9MICO